MHADSGAPGLVELVFSFHVENRRFDSQGGMCSLITFNLINQGPVVQSIVSLTSSLRGQLVKCFMIL